MAQRDGAAVHVHLVAIQLQITDKLFRNHGKGFVDFPQVDIINGKPGLGQRLAGGRHRRIQHQCRAIAHVGHGHDTGARLQAVLFGIGLAGQQHGGGAIDHARRVAGMVHMLDLQIGIFGVDQLAEGRALRVQRHVRDLGEARL